MFSLFYSILFIFFSLETIAYPNFIKSNLNINPYFLLYFYIIFTLVYSLFKKPKFNLILLKLNKLVFPISILSLFILFFVESITYKNFVFTYFHIHFNVLINFILLSLVTFYTFNQPQKILKKIFYLIPPILLFIFILLEKFQSELFIDILEEDGIAETFQFLLYFLSSIFLYKSSKKITGKTKIIYLILFIGLIFVAGEEISWGQRILGIETPESYKQINQQNEITLHNINFIHFNLLHEAFMLVGLIGSISHFFIKKFIKNKQISILFPEKFLYFGFLLTFLYYFAYHYYLDPKRILFSNVPIVIWLEMVETFLAFAFFGHFLNVYQKISQSESKLKTRQKI